MNIHDQVTWLSLGGPSDMEVTMSLRFGRSVIAMSVIAFATVLGSAPMMAQAAPQAAVITPDDGSVDPSPYFVGPPSTTEDGTVFYPAEGEYEVRIGGQLDVLPPTDDPTDDSGSTLVAPETSVGATEAEAGTNAASGTTRSYDVICRFRIEYPHWSNGAGGTIFKTYVRCTGWGLATVRVTVNGWLGFLPSSTGQLPSNPAFFQRGTSSQTQTLTVNARNELPFYTPGVGSHAGWGTGFWRASFRGFISSPRQSAVSGQVVTVWRSIPRR